MTTLAIMKARIASEITRSDLTTQIANAISDAIAVYQSERFRFSDSPPNAPATFNTVVNQSVYTASDLAGIGTLFHIDGVYALIGSMQQPLRREAPGDLFELNENTTGGPPTLYAYADNQLVLSPTPAGVYVMTLDAFRAVAAPASEDEANNPWMVEGERLIRARAKYEIAVHVTRNKMMADAMSPDEDARGAAWRAYNDLKRQTNRVNATGRIRAMQF